MTTPPLPPRAGRILAVDDDVVTLKLVRMLCQKLNYDVIEAMSVAEAQRVLEQWSGTYFNCLLTDFRMPGKTGLDLYEWVKEFDPTLSAILVTAEGEKSLIAHSLRAGFIDFLDKPVNPQELGIALSRACIATANKRGIDQIALEVTDAAITQKLISGVALRGRVETVHEVPRVRVCLESPQETGGDFVSVLPLANGGLWVLVGDVSGHNLRAAFLTAYFQGAFRALAEKSASPMEVFQFFSSFLTTDWPTGPHSGSGHTSIPMSLATCSLVLNQTTDQLTVTNAGLPCPLMCEPEGTVKMIGTGTPPLGWMNPPITSHERQTFMAGSRIWQWSDGLEDVATYAEVDSLSIFHALLYGTPEVRERLLKKPKDDVLLLAIDWKEIVEDYSFLPFIWQTYPGDGAKKVDAYQRLWEQSLALVCPDLSESQRYEIILCTREALLNGFAHGCGHHPEDKVVLTVSLRTAPLTLRVRVDDPGDGHDHDPEEVHSGEIIETHCGLFLIQQMTSRTMLERSGATLIMDFDLDNPTPNLNNVDSDISRK